MTTIMRRNLMAEIHRHDLICTKCIEDAGCRAASGVMRLSGWAEHWSGGYPELLPHYHAGCIVCGGTDADLRVTCVCNVDIIRRGKG